MASQAGNPGEKKPRPRGGRTAQDGRRKAAPETSPRIGVLTKSDIQADGIICENACPDGFEAASYDMRLKNEYIKPKKGGNGTTEKCIHSKDGPTLTIKAYSNAIVATHEILKLPDDVIGRFNLRIKIALRGLFVQMGTQIEPGFHGRLFALIHNISSEDITIKLENEPFFTVEFFYIGKEVAVSGEERRKYSSFHDVFNASSIFIKGSLSNVVDGVQADTQAALVRSEAAVVASQSAEKSLNKATGQRNLIYTGVIAFVVTLVGSAVAPILISWAIDYRHSSIDSSVNNAINTLKPDIESLRATASSDSARLNEIINSLEKRIDDMGAEISKLSANATSVRSTENAEDAQRSGASEGQ